MAGAIATTRGCGTRHKGAIYAECGVGPGGLPLEYFIVDPPELLAAALGVIPRGVTLVSQNLSDGRIIYHIADWVGEENYENVWDFLAEARRFGVSRRLSELTQFEKITKESRLLLIHPRAAILNPERYVGRDEKRFGSFVQSPHNEHEYKKFGGWRCPKRMATHEPMHPVKPCCAGIWAQDVERGRSLTAAEKAIFAKEGKVLSVDAVPYDAEDPRLVWRRTPSVQYIARRAPEGVEPVYHPAFFLSLPLTRIVVIQGEGDSKSIALANAAKDVDVKVVTE